MRFVAVVGVVVALAHAGLWAASRHVISAPDFSGQLASVSYTPFDGSARAGSGRSASPEQIRADLAAIAPYTRTVRTYSSTGGAELVPEIAREFGLRVSVGAWIDRDNERNQREMSAVIDLVRKQRNIDSVVVGNETIYRGDQTVEELVKKIHRVKRETSVPVTTGEIWHAWIDHPELVSAVDFIAAHVLPYWEGIPESAAVDQAIRIYDRLRQAYPGKRIVIAEFGWPSAGYNRRAANPDSLVQAAVLRDFVNRAEAHGIDYNII
jgi:exo-beta-1,3-glucanase (GH17 family)